MAEIRKTIDIQAIFSDESERFRVPAEPVAGGKVTIRIRTGKDNVDTVILHRRTRKNGEVHPGQDLIMKKVFRNEPLDDSDELMEGEEPKRHYDAQFDYYELRLPVGDEPFWYYFLLSKDGAGVCYNQRGAGTNADPRYDFVVRPGVHVPDWAKGSVMYQIFTDRFCNGDPSNDVLDREYLYVQNIPSERVKHWDDDLLSLDVGRFYGGDLQGVLDKLDYLQELGVEVIYFNPLFVSPSNHKYDIQDYDYIDPHLGVIIEDEGDLLPEGALDNRDATRYICRVTSFKNLEASNALFEKLCKEIHARGMRVIIDGVFNHCGSFNKWFDREHIYDGREGYEKGAYVSKDSPYRKYFTIQKSGMARSHTAFYHIYFLFYILLVIYLLHSYFHQILQSMT